MGIFGFLGKAAKAVGKVAIGVGKTAVNAAGSYVGVGAVFKSGGGGDSGGVAQATVASVNPNVSDGGTRPSNGGLGGALTDALSGVGNWLNGRTATQNNVNVGTQTGSGLPPWLLPVGAGVALIAFLSSGNKRRY